MREVDKQAKMPMYQQIKEILEEAIAKGEYEEGSKLPTESELCRRCGVSRITVVRAFEQLEQSGLIYRVQGKGSFVCAKKVERDLTNGRSFMELIREQGYNPVTKVIAKEFVKATKKLNGQFKREADSKEEYVSIKRLRYIDEKPVGISISITEIDFSAKLNIEAFEGSMYELLTQAYGSVYCADEIISVSTVRESESELLGVPVGFPVFVVESVTYSKDGATIEVSRSIFRGDKVKFHNRAQRYLVYQGEREGENTN